MAEQGDHDHEEEIGCEFAKPDLYRMIETLEKAFETTDWRQLRDSSSEKVKLVKTDTANAGIGSAYEKEAANTKHAAYKVC